MQFGQITLRIHVYCHGLSLLHGSLFWCRRKDEGQPLDPYEPLRQRETETLRSPGSIVPHRAAGKKKKQKTFQQILMVFLVNSRNNESAVPPPEFLLSTPTLNIKISRISFSSLRSLCSSPLFYSVALFQPSVNIRDSLSSFLSSLTLCCYVSLMITASLTDKCRICTYHRLPSVLYSPFL